MAAAVRRSIAEASPVRHEGLEPLIEHFDGLYAGQVALIHPLREDVRAPQNVVNLCTIKPKSQCVIAGADPGSAEPQKNLCTPNFTSHV